MIVKSKDDKQNGSDWLLKQMHWFDVLKLWSGNERGPVKIIYVLVTQTDSLSHGGVHIKWGQVNWFNCKVMTSKLQFKVCCSYIEAGVKWQMPDVA